MVLGNFGWDVGYEDSPVSIELFHGDITDLASMPFKWMRRGGKKSRPAAIHDKPYKAPYTYGLKVYYEAASHGLLPKECLHEASLCERVRIFTDVQFRDACKAVGISSFKSWAYYRAVRFGGRRTWEERWTKGL